MKSGEEEKGKRNVYLRWMDPREVMCGREAFQENEAE